MKHKRISRKALSLVLALVLSLSMIAVGSFTAHAWTSYYVTGDDFGGFSEKNTTYPVNKIYASTQGKFYATVSLTNGKYFKLNANDKYYGPASDTDMDVGTTAVQLSEGGSGAFRFTGTTGTYNLCIDLTNGRDNSPYLWLEASSSSAPWALIGNITGTTWANTYDAAGIKFKQESTNVFYAEATVTSNEKYFRFIKSDNTQYGPSGGGNADVVSYNSSSKTYNNNVTDGYGAYYISTPGKYKIYINTASTPKLWVVATSTPTQPTTAQPTTAQPTTAQPTTAQPTTLQPTTAQPTTVAPTSEPSTTQPGGTVLNNVNIYFKGTTLTYLKPAMTLTDSSGTSTPYTMTKDSYIGTYITGTYKFYWYKATIPTVTVGDSYKITFKTAGSNMEASMNLDFSSCPTDNNMYFGVDNLQIGTKLVDLSNNETAKLCFRSSVNMFTNVAGEPYDPTLTLATVNVSAVSGGETVSYELGDSDMNRSLNILDATKNQMILTYADGINSTEKLLADFDVSGSADIKDVSYLQMYLAKI